MTTTLIEQIKQLSVAEQLDLVMMVWDDLLDQPQDIPIPDWHQEEIERRLQVHEGDPLAGSSWEEVKSRVLIPKRA